MDSPKVAENDGARLGERDDSRRRCRLTRTRVCVTELGTAAPVGERMTRYRFRLRLSQILASARSLSDCSMGLAGSTERFR